MTHTPDPWGVETTDTTLWVGPMRHGGKVEDVVTAIDCNLHHYKREYLDKQRANARRIVACVNALSGISTEAIEAGAVAELVAILRDAKSQCGAMTTAFENRIDTALSQLAEASNA